MKRITSIILSLCALALLPACTDENQEARTPVADVSVSAYSLEINQSMEIVFNGVADQVVIYTGDDGHDYSLRSESNTGFVVNKGVFTYSYSTPGVFHVVCVATTYDTYLGENMKTAVTEFDVTVIDDVTTIDKLYSSITPNVYYAELVDEQNWVLRIPKKQVYNNREINLNAARQRLSFDISSDSSKIYVDDVLYAARTYYDLTKTHSIRVVSNAGTTRDYTLHTLVFPEFNSVTVAGTTATQSRNAYYQDLLTYTVQLPAGTYASSVTLSFNVDDNVKFYIDGRETASGATVDLSDESATYTLKRTLADYPAVSATSTVVFNITYK